MVALRAKVESDRWQDVLPIIEETVEENSKRHLRLYDNITGTTNIEGGLAV